MKALKVVEPVSSVASPVEFTIAADVLLGAVKVPRGLDAEGKACFKAVCQPGLVMANRAAATQNINPVLNHVRLTGCSRGLVIQSTDGEFSIKQVLPVGHLPEFDTLVPMALLLKLVKMFKGKELAVKVIPGTITLGTNKSSYDLTCMDTEHFPDFFHKVKFKKVLDFACCDFKTALGRVLFCAVKESSTDAVHYTNGVLLKRDGQTFDMVATDGHRMGVFRWDVVGSDGVSDIETIMPANSACELQTMLPESANRICVWLVAKDTVQFQWQTDLGEVQVLAKVLDIKYPDYNRVIPNEHESKLHVGRQELIESLNRVLFMCQQKDKTPVAHFTWENDHLVITGDSGEIGKGRETLACEQTGSGEIAVNPKYVLDFLNQASGGDFTLKWLSIVNPLVLTSPREPEFTYVLMPIRMD